MQQDKESLTVSWVMMLGDDAILAFSALASVQLPATVGASNPCVVVFTDQLLIAEVTQLDGSWNRLTQEVTFIFRLRR